MKIDDIYPAYNARHLKPNEVGESFIWSANFQKLIQNGHSVILGARGCGKTTLMKMLTIPALNSWNDERANVIKSNIPFYAVYISTDIYWDVKNQTSSAQLERFKNFDEIISAFSVNSNVFTSLCDTLQYIIGEKDYDESKEIELCKSLIEAWQLNHVIPKLNFVREALNKRVDEVNQLVQDLIFNYKDGDEIPYHSYFNLSFESSLEVIIPIFERIYKIQNGKSWALCFDELEFAPLWLQQKLFRSLRSRKQFLIYKLSASPILSSELEKLMQSEYAATSGNDLQLIKMWNSSDTETFSLQIIDSLLRKKFNGKKASDFFGSNEIYNSSNLYTKGSTFYRKIIELAKKDESFADFLKTKNINPDHPIMDDRHLRDTLFRKIKPIVYFRSFYIDEIETDIHNKTNKVSYRSRKKTKDLFSGIEVLSKICDGNPRWLIGIINSILLKASDKNAEKQLQFDELRSAALKFKNVIANIPIGNNTNLPLIDIIERIGIFFRYQVLGEKFQMDPRGTFVVDINSTEVPDDIIFLLEKAVSQGAIILVDSNDDSFDFKIRGKKFKLAYLFSLLYYLPLRNYPDAKLSECLRGVRYLNQKTLFD
jgi:energy-coupling factor transporter ATP-binding protein EcfA2